MKLLKCLALAGFFTGTLLPLGAQIIHLSLQAPARFVAQQGGVSPFAFADDSILTLDLTYDASCRKLGVDETGAHVFDLADELDRNCWRIRVGDVDVTGPLNLLNVRDRELQFQFVDDQWPSNFYAFTAQLEFEGAVFAGDRLTLPSSPLARPADDEFRVLVLGLPEFLDDLRQPSGAIHIGAFTEISASLLAAPITPVPEPATYGWIATGVLGIVLVWRRRRVGVSAGR